MNARPRGAFVRSSADKLSGLSQRLLLAKRGAAPSNRSARATKLSVRPRSSSGAIHRYGKNMNTSVRSFRTSISSLVLLAAALVTPGLRGQVFIGSDNFNDNTLTTQYAINGSAQYSQAAGQWRGGTTQGGSAWTETNQRMEFTTPTATTSGSGLSGYLTWISPGSGTNAIGRVGLNGADPWSSSWVAQVETTAQTSAIGAGYINAGLVCYSLTSALENNSLFSLYLAGSAASSNVVLQIDNRLSGGTYDTTLTSAATSDTTDVTLRFSYDGASHLLSPSYSFNGTSFISLGSYDLAGAFGGTDVPPYGGGFGLQLYGGAADGAPQVTSGMIAFDNFSVTSVPEPSTYAALAGLAALGVALWRRQRRAAKQA